MTIKYYTGIGSIDITGEEFTTIQSIAKWLSSQGYVLRSGHAKGSDEAFEYGASLDSTQFNRDIFVPWNNFDGAEVESKLINVGNWDSTKLYLCECIARCMHGGWHNLSSGAKSLHSRNVPQVLGMDLKTPSSFVLFCSDTTSGGNVKGGTATAVKIAKAWQIPCLNIRGKTKKEIFDFIKNFL